MAKYIQKNALQNFYHFVRVRVAYQPHVNFQYCLLSKIDIFFLKRVFHIYKLYNLASKQHFKHMATSIAYSLICSKFFTRHAFVPLMLFLPKVLNCANDSFRLQTSLHSVQPVIDTSCTQLWSGYVLVPHYGFSSQRFLKCSVFWQFSGKKIGEIIKMPHPWFKLGILSLLIGLADNNNKKPSWS